MTRRERSSRGYIGQGEGGEDGIESAVYRKEGKDIVLTEPDIKNIVRAEAAT